MDYKEKIIELLDKVKTENTFKRVYKLLEYLYLKENCRTHENRCGILIILFLNHLEKQRNNIQIRNYHT